MRSESELQQTAAMASNPVNRMPSNSIPPRPGAFSALEYLLGLLQPKAGKTANAFNLLSGASPTQSLPGPVPAQLMSDSEFVSRCAAVTSQA